MVVVVEMVVLVVVVGHHFGEARHVADGRHLIRRARNLGFRRPQAEHRRQRQLSIDREASRATRRGFTSAAVAPACVWPAQNTDGHDWDMMRSKNWIQ